MSAYIMADDEINTIVSYFIDPNHGVDSGAWVRLGESEWNYLAEGNAAKVAAILKAENIRSVNAKYGDNENPAYVFEYDRKARNRPVGNIIGALDCYEYQACETNDWHTSLAHEIIGDLRKHLLKVIAEADGTYTWGIK
jgi:hypothetical protein